VVTGQFTDTPNHRLPTRRLGILQTRQSSPVWCDERRKSSLLTSRIKGVKVLVIFNIFLQLCSIKYTVIWWQLICISVPHALRIQQRRWWPIHMCIDVAGVIIDRVFVDW